MSKDYSWIKPGVKAVIIDDLEPKGKTLIGRVVTISSVPYFSDYTCDSQGVIEKAYYVDVEEGADIALEFGMFGYSYVARPEHLKPYKEDDDSRDLTTWDEIKKITGVDIRHTETV